MAELAEAADKAGAAVRLAEAAAEDVAEVVHNQQEALAAVRENDDLPEPVKA